MAMGFSIKELETISGIKAHTIRIWEQRYRFLKPSRTATNIRTYSNDELKTLLTVALLNKYGYKISRIDDMAPAHRQQVALALGEPEARNEYLTNEMIGAMIDLEPQRFEAILNGHIQEHGIEKTITSLALHFLEKVGILWQTDRINPAQEHIVSNIIRQKIICGIELLPLPQRQHPLFLLFLPEGEFHELGLLFVYFSLRKSGLPVLYLGANVPVKDVEYVVRIKNPQYLYMHLTSLPRQVKFDRLVAQLLQYDIRLLLSGSVAEHHRKPAHSRLTFLPSIPAVQAFFSTL